MIPGEQIDSTVLIIKAKNFFRGQNRTCSVSPLWSPGGLRGAESEHHLPENDPSYRPGPDQSQDEPGRTNTRQHMSTHVSTRQHMSTHVNTCQHTSLWTHRGER